MNVKSEEEWAQRAAAFLQHKVKDADITYIELGRRLRKHGIMETEASITSKLARGTFPATSLSRMHCSARTGRDNNGRGLSLLKATGS